MTTIQDTVANAEGARAIIAAVPTITTTIQSVGNQVSDTLAASEDSTPRVSSRRVQGRRELQDATAGS